MLIAHLPAGYVVTRKLQDATGVGSFLWLGLLASVLPDLDLFWFYFVDHKQTLHHEYFMHAPLFWLLVFASTLLVLFAFQKLNRRNCAIALFFFGNLFVHFILDSVTGGINWGAPFFNTYVLLFEIPKNFEWWVWSFVFHPTFLFEIAVVLYAVSLLLKDIRTYKLP